MANIEVCAALECNWRSLDECFQMVEKAKAAGADLVKLQAFSRRYALTHPNASVRGRLHECVLLEGAKGELISEECDDQGIEFFATPFSAEAVGYLEKLGVKRYKVRYADSQNTDLLNRVADTGKRFYVSYTKYPEEAFMWMKNWQNMTPLYCVPDYSGDLDGFSPFSLRGFATQSSRWGFSSHFPTVEPALLSASMGASYIEQHVTLSKARKDDPDQPVSITFRQLADLVRHIRVLEKMKLSDNVEVF